MTDPTLDEKGNLHPRPPYHPAIQSQLQHLQPSNTLTLSSLPSLRDQTSAATVTGNRPTHHTSTSIQPPDTPHSTTISLFTRNDAALNDPPRLAILHIHGAGTVAGTRFLGMSEVLAWVVAFDVVAVSGLSTGSRPSIAFQLGWRTARLCFARCARDRRSLALMGRRYASWRGAGARC
ncbi:hypothetical protein BU26DRAFT_522957 [Trematosphaeria pertusa]|uniref:Alpha/beta-hydrolase n=1 Tax=Trematosphaeria pertusa TaxID=390896 RepID=A0A6A6I2A3_9PLEO|nr:uncharacterized protein BU26DRAFT_522957 [Trematosphaeria pertusa]KAF2244289.1 hypothetical protein BU26DRAFT_522957 [Trematosphaeria pertusa]